MHIGDLAGFSELSGLSDATTQVAAGTSTQTTPTTVPGFMDGLKAWASPSAALAMFPMLGTVYQVAGTGYVLGFLTPPLALAGLVLVMMSGKSR